MLGGVGTSRGRSLGTAATPFAEAQSVPPNRGRRVARPEPSAKGVVVRFRGYRETVMLGGVGTCQGLRRLAPQPRPSLRLRACHPTAVGGWHALSPRRRAWWCVLEAIERLLCWEVWGPARGCVAWHRSHAPLSLRLGEFHPNAVGRVARLEPPAKGVVVRIRAIGERLCMLGGSGEAAWWAASPLAPRGTLCRRGAERDTRRGGRRVARSEPRRRAWWMRSRDYWSGTL